MKNRDIITTWEKAGKQFENINPVHREDIRKSLVKKTKKTTPGLKFSIYTNIVVLFAVIILSLINIWLYRSNTIIIILSAAFIFITFVLLIFGLNKIKELKIIEKNDETILNTLNTKISFFRSLSFVWPLLSAISYIILISLVNMIVDCDNGIYKIYNTGRFILITLAIFIFLFAVNYFSHMSHLTEIKNQIRELSEDYSDKKHKKIKLIIRIIVALILTVVLVLGIITALK